MLMPFLNGSLIPLFMQCVVFDLDDIYKELTNTSDHRGPASVDAEYGAEYGSLSAPHLFTTLVSSATHSALTLMCSAMWLKTSATSFSCGPSFGTLLPHQITQRELSIIDLQAELKARDPSGSGSLACGSREV
ncbi:hypothetical protein PF010_g17829 [Phytophthora fragariae]|uniref:Uncharacterized protein n=1 Tax=Phytophthora fragariae TaxID=53985 RepID=A0A6A3T1H7_9STRA|nr:hypothetical protein PF003_g8633 [Phytophthora fragariae]KAE8930044.1 hypothetical protein PF009_g19859 [Phytophthora fragariae]KAE9090798.1 hypothetical protein PF007_g19105 [Phytophthora fragariae]KAE9092368.1 hypothetical protein PF010_g17829 [Phytophthora fragariae]KAE9125508.1 hypothetical protein PF006_g16952 [Phytophthora fragariae]